ncbi:MAG TPA: rhodanese-like domain-containing protein, partial [Bdellovibrionales bacterium]|nr:rhodanese-like domain-containing protein [Bdellovibrionales bacterium]
MRLIAVALILLLSACQTQPTKVSSNQERKFEGDALTQPIKIVPETIVLDARPAFDFSTAHIPRSINLNWSDFTEPEPAQRGIMQADLFGAARRLARLGISPESHVVVVGNGIYGNGEEGRVAWMLVYMGLNKVQFASLEALKPRVTNVIDTSSIKAVPMWKPEVRASLNVTRDEVIFAINERGVEKPISFKGGPALV